jgi:hypothetical protein
MRSMHRGILLIGLVTLGAHDALALAGLSEPAGFGDGVFMCVGLSWFVALPLAIVLSVLIAVLRAKRARRCGLKPHSAVTFGLSLRSPNQVLVAMGNPRHNRDVLPENV